MEVSCWQFPPEKLFFFAGQIHVWRLRLDLSAPAVDNLKELLSADELSRAQRLKIVTKQQQFIVARSRMRQILGRYLDRDPATLEFCYGEYGKPALKDPSSGLNFNLAHSGDWALLVLSKSGPIGVDLEYVDSALDYSILSERYFSSQELNELMRAAEWRKRRSFYRLWTLKESRLKFLGKGFAANIDPAIGANVVNKLIPVSRKYLGALTAPEGVTSILRCQLIGN